MAANILPSGIHDLFSLATTNLTGLETHGPWLLTGSMTAEQFAAVLTASTAAEVTFARARSAKAQAAARVEMADEKLTSWLAKARLVVMLALGSKWSESWLATGFTHRGTNVPKRMGPRMELGRRVAGFLSEHGQFEVPFAEVTSAAGKALYDQMVAAKKELALATSEAGLAKRARDTAEKGLRRQMRNLRVLLQVSLANTDPRWQIFGFNVPKPNESKRVFAARNTDAAPVKVNFAAADSEPLQAAVA